MQKKRRGVESLRSIGEGFKPDGWGLKRTYRLVAQLESTWRLHGTLAICLAAYLRLRNKFFLAVSINRELGVPVMPNKVIPPHKHLREDEVFTVLEGQFEFYAGGAWSHFHAGETRISLRGNYHAFRNVGSAPGRMMLVTSGGGIDEYFENISELRLPQDQGRLAEISSYYGYYYLPPA